MARFVPKALGSAAFAPRHAGLDGAAFQRLPFLGAPALLTNYHADAEAVWEAMTSPPTDARRGHIDTLIKALDAGGVWPKLDLMYVPAAHDAQAGRINWRDPGTFDLTESGTLTHLADRHYVGNGVNGHLPTGFTPSTHAQHMAQNSAMLAVWVRNDVSSASQYEIGGTTSGGSYVNARSGANAVGKINGGAVSRALGTATSVGFTAVDRADSANLRFYKNGVLLGSNADASTALMSVPLVLLRHSGAYSTRQLSVALVGASLTDGEHAAAAAAASAYLTALGAA